MIWVKKVFIEKDKEDFLLVPKIIRDGLREIAPYLENSILNIYDNLLTVRQA